MNMDRYKKNMKKKFVIIGSLIFLGLVMIICIGIFLFLFFTGWFDEKVEACSGSFVIDNIAYPEDYEELSNSHSSKNAYDFSFPFVYFDGADISYVIDVGLKQGSMTAEILNLKDNPCYFEGTAYEVVCELKIDSSGSYTLSIPKDDLVVGDRYILYIYGSEDCAMSTSVCVYYSVYRWQQLHDEKLTWLPWVDEKYNPMASWYGDWGE